MEFAGTHLMVDFHVFVLFLFLLCCSYFSFFLFSLQLTGDSQNFSSQENDTLPQLLSMYSLYLYFLFFSFISFGISTQPLYQTKEYRRSILPLSFISEDSLGPLRRFHPPPLAPFISLDPPQDRTFIGSSNYKICGRKDRSRGWLKICGFENVKRKDWVGASDCEIW